MRRLVVFSLFAVGIGLLLVPLSGASFGASFYASPAQKDALYSDVGVSDAGNAVFVWRTSADYSCNCSEVEVRTRSAGGAFGAVQQLSTTDETGVVYSYPKIAVDGDGDSVAVWTSYLTNSAVRARARSKTGTLGPILTISPKAAASNAVLIGMSKAGKAVFMWSSQDSGNNYRIYARALSPTGVLGPIISLSGPNSFLTESYTPQGRLAVDSQGDAIFVWKRQVSGPSSTQYLVEMRTLSAAGALGPVQVVASATGTSNDPYAVGDPAVAVDTDGDGLIVFTQVAQIASSPCYHNLCTEIAARPVSKTGVLGAGGFLTSGKQNYSDPNVGVDGDGDAYVAWITGDTYHELAQGRARSRTGAISPIQSLSQAIGVGGPIVRSDKVGNTLIAWHWSGAYAVAGSQARSRSSAGVLSGLRTFGIANRIASVNGVAVDANGRMVVAWDQTDGVAGQCGQSYGCWRSAAIVGP